MTDAQQIPHQVKAIHRADYRPPEWLVPEVALDVALDPAATRVGARLEVRRNGTHGAPLRLDGHGLRALSVRVDGRPGLWRMDGDVLVVVLTGEAHLVETEVVVAPDRNTQLMGLYASGGLLCTQCEAEGFRRITFFPDRPDVLSRYSVRIEAERNSYPILLSNGDLVASGELDTRHWVEWHDPFPKPCYLFALVAGDLAANRDSFVTMSGRQVDLAIWADAGDLPKTAHAMSALKAAMAWDEQAYGREYDLSVFNIVAVADFNFGAMENKGLNIFNSRYILADPETATDADYDAVAGVVAHEYFHNWSGNRVTCRDWFQLSLKEGFTVFRDQGFSADQGSPAVKRIEDVRALRSAQFPEDAGPLAHPIRPESYFEISNFYTATIYNKGAEVVGMLRTLLGADAFRRGSDLYFAQHDGTAATCEDFVRAMEEASGQDLTAFRRWYEQAGTPRVTASLSRAGGEVRLSLSQLIPPTPGQPTKQPMPIPLRAALFDAATGLRVGEERMIVLDDIAMDIAFEERPEQPVLSINRGFSAPIVLDSDRSSVDLAFLSAHDDDPFARYEAMQQLMVDTIALAVGGRESDPGGVVDAIGRALADPALDDAFVAEMVTLPSESLLGDRMLIVDPVLVRRARETLRGAIARAHFEAWGEIHASRASGGFSLSPEAKAARRLRTTALGYIAAGGARDADRVAYGHYLAADNMTDRQGALAVLANGDAPERAAALADFYERYRGNALVLDKWFSVQALAMRDDVIDTVEALAVHPDFTLANPNRVRALVGSFASNQCAFHDPSGRGYGFLSRMILAVDALNPQTAARLVAPLGRWRRFDEDRAALMRAELKRIVSASGLSRDVLEQAGKSLGDVSA